MARASTLAMKTPGCCNGLAGREFIVCKCLERILSRPRGAVRIGRVHRRQDQREPCAEVDNEGWGLFLRALFDPLVDRLRHLFFGARLAALGIITTLLCGLLGGLAFGRAESTVEAIRAALESAGVEFIPENGGGAGVRLRKISV
jgi:hypothetical protein